jgi:hypothetical protein
LLAFIAEDPDDGEGPEVGTSCAGVVIGLGAAVRSQVQLFMEAERITGQTNAVLRSTGGCGRRRSWLSC